MEIMNNSVAAFTLVILNLHFSTSTAYMENVYNVIVIIVAYIMMALQGEGTLIV